MKLGDIIKYCTIDGKSKEGVLFSFDGKIIDYDGYVLLKNEAIYTDTINEPDETINIVPVRFLMEKIK